MPLAGPAAAQLGSSVVPLEKKLASALRGCRSRLTEYACTLHRICLGEDHGMRPYPEALFQTPSLELHQSPSTTCVGTTVYSHDTMQRVALQSASSSSNVLCQQTEILSFEFRLWPKMMKITTPTSLWLLSLRCLLQLWLAAHRLPIEVHRGDSYACMSPPPVPACMHVGPGMHACGVREGRICSSHLPFQNDFSCHSRLLMSRIMLLLIWRPDRRGRQFTSSWTERWR